MLNSLLALVLVGLVGSTPTSSEEEVQIVGGEDIDIKEAPYQVSLQKDGRHWCGGSVISKDIVLTAAHCVIRFNASDFHIRAGSSSEKKGGVLVAVRDMIMHPDYTLEYRDSDVAVLWLAQPLVFSNTVTSVPLIKPGEEIKDGELTTVTGWGLIKESGVRPNTLQRVNVYKVNEATCKEVYEKSKINITSTMLCAGVKEGRKGPYKGDSGGPLVHNGKQIGIVSWGYVCVIPDYPGVYTKVSALRKWIDEKIAFFRSQRLL